MFWIDYSSFCRYFGSAVVCKLRSDWTSVPDLTLQLLSSDRHTCTCIDLGIFVPTALDVRGFLCVCAVVLRCNTSRLEFPLPRPLSLSRALFLLHRRCAYISRAATTRRMMRSWQGTCAEKGFTPKAPKAHVAATYLTHSRARSRLPQDLGIALMHIPHDARDVSEGRCVQYLELKCEEQRVLETELLDPLRGRYLLVVISFKALCAPESRTVSVDVHSSKPVRAAGIALHRQCRPPRC